VQDLHGRGVLEIRFVPFIDWLEQSLTARNASKESGGPENGCA
jgi:hypothetical protein